MRAAAILGLGSSTSHLQPFASISDAHWQTGLPAHSNQADAILIFGGDGTVHRYLTQLVELQLPVLVVPHGSGNDFARALGLKSVRKAVEAWRRFDSEQTNLRTVDLGAITAVSSSGSPSGTPRSEPRYFCCIGGIGLDAEVSRRANQLPRTLRRRGGYLLSLGTALFGFKPVAVAVQALPENQSNELETRHQGPAMLVAFANTPTYGGGIRIAPHARLDDGKLDIFVVRAMAKTRLLRLFPSVYSGRHIDLPEVEHFQSERLHIETERPVDVYADGEYVCHTPVEVTVKRAALKVILPA